MNTLLLTLEYPPFHGGVANYYANLVKYWPDSESIFVLDNHQNKLLNHHLPFWKWLPSLFILRSIIQKKKLNHVLVGHILPLGIITWLFSFFEKLQYSVILHGMDLEYSQKNFRKRLISKIILKKAKTIICVNSYTAKRVCKFYPAFSNKIIIANPGFDGQFYFNHKPQIQAKKLEIQKKLNLENKIVLLSLGRLVRRKGHDMVMRSLPEVLKEIPSLVYIIAGKGDDQEYLEHISNDLGLRDNILFINNIDEINKWAYLDLADIFIMPSRDIDGDVEGFGIVYLEAGFCAKPVIAGDCGGVGDVICDLKNGLLVNGESKEEIKESILKLAKNQDLRNKLGENGRQKVLEKFRWEDQVRKIYESVINSK